MCRVRVVPAELAAVRLACIGMLCYLASGCHLRSQPAAWRGPETMLGPSSSASTVTAADLLAEAMPRFLTLRYRDTGSTDLRVPARRTGGINLAVMGRLCTACLSLPPTLQADWSASAGAGLSLASEDEDFCSTCLEGYSDGARLRRHPRARRRPATGGHGICSSLVVGRGRQPCQSHRGVTLTACVWPP